MMETLLTPAESMAFQSFLSSVDDKQPPADWASYASQFNHQAIRKQNDDLMLETVPKPHENDPLTKATKDLMSLDGGMWSGAGGNSQQMVVDHSHPRHHQQPYYNHLGQAVHHGQQQHYGQSSQSPSANESFPFLSSRSHSGQPGGSFHQGQQQQQAYHYGFPNQGYHQNQPFSGPSGSDIGFNSHSHPSQQPHLPPPLPHSHSQSSVASSSKRSTRASPISRASSSPAAAGPSTTVKRSAAANASNSRSSASSQSPHPQGNKPALLSPSQKKANHIQSEQKRRANIRRGYEALCETVPALREAIREEEEEAKAIALAAAAGLPNKTKAAKKRGGKKKDGEDSAKDKIDGRAGPRSENVVLSKTIDYIHDLLSERAALLGRLQRARSMLPAGHPGLVPHGPPLWEREWKGGEGKEGNEDGDESDDNEGEDHDDVQAEMPIPTQGTKGPVSARASRRGRDSD